jgi:hypothetical protein
MRKRNDTPIQIAFASVTAAVCAEYGLAPDSPTARSPLALALRHIAQHENRRDPSRCDRVPCRVGGLSFALYELAAYRADVEQGDDLVAAAEVVAELRSALRRLEPKIACVVAAIRARSEIAHEIEKGGGPATHDHATWCERPSTLLARFDALCAAVDGAPEAPGRLDDLIRSGYRSPEHRQRGDKKPADLCITAVCQHLAWGGFTNREIAGLIGELSPAPPDERPMSRIDDLRKRDRIERDRKMAEDRVRKRVDSPDTRSIHAYPPRSAPAEGSTSGDSSG